MRLGSDSGYRNARTSGAHAVNNDDNGSFFRSVFTALVGSVG